MSLTMTTSDRDQSSQVLLSTGECGNNGSNVRRVLSSGSSSSSMLLLALSATLLVLAILGPAIVVVEAKPDFIQPFQIRSSALKALRDLDSYAAHNARPRFGKRFGNEKMTVPVAAAMAGGDYPVTDPLMGSIIGDRWILINRNRPLTKLTESYLREILAENDRAREMQNGGADQESILK